MYNAAYSELNALLTSEGLMKELLDVLQRPKFAPALTAIHKSAEELVREHREIAELVPQIEIQSNVIRDPKDRIVLGCALGGNATYIVSGDKDLLVLKRYQQILIVSAAQFLEMLNEQ